MNYTLHQLKVFKTITETKSITKAAEVLHLTQPAVSIQLKNFQDQFEIPLTETVGRKLYITDFGIEISEAAQKILEEVYAINYKTMAYKGKLTGRLIISSVSTGKYVMPYLLSDFLAANEGVELSLDVTNKQQVLNNLNNNEVDFSLVSVMPSEFNIEDIELLPNQLFLVAPKGLLNPKTNHPKKILEKIPLIFREEGSGTRYTIEKFLQKNNLNVRKKLVLTSNEAVKQAVIAGLGCSILPLIGIKNELKDKDMELIPVVGLPVASTWRLIWLKSKKLSPAAMAFKEYLSDNKQKLMSDKFGWINQYGK